MINYLLHKTRIIVLKFEKLYFQDKDKAIEWLKSKLATSSSKMQNMVTNIISRKYPEIEL